MKATLQIIGVDGGDKRTCASIDFTITIQSQPNTEVDFQVVENDIPCLRTVRIGKNEFNPEELSFDFLEEIKISDILSENNIQPENEHYSKRGYKSLCTVTDKFEFDIEDDVFNRFIAEFNNMKPCNSNGPYLGEHRLALEHLAWGGNWNVACQKTKKSLIKLGYCSNDGKLTKAGIKRCIDEKIRFLFSDFKIRIADKIYRDTNGYLTICGNDYVQMSGINMKDPEVELVLTEIRQLFNEWYKNLREIGNGVEPDIVINDWLDDETKKLLKSRALSS